jgi:hypothetical protein
VAHRFAEFFAFCCKKFRALSCRSTIAARCGVVAAWLQLAQRTITKGTIVSDNFDIRFEYLTDFRRSYAAGVWGGLTGNGQIAADFFVDMQPHPVTVTVNGPTSSEVSRELPPFTIRREFHSGVVLSAEDAVIIGQWFLTMASQVFEARQQVVDGETASRTSSDQAGG